LYESDPQQSQNSLGKRAARATAFSNREVTAALCDNCLDSPLAQH